MDAQHRHELKENDLAEFLGNFGQWWTKHGNKLLIALLLGLGIFTAIRWSDTRTRNQKESAWRDLSQTTSPDGYRSVALSYQDPAVRGLAYLRGADLLLANASVGLSEPSNGNQADPTAPSTTDHGQSTQQQLQGAMLMYQEVLNDDRVHRALKLNAHLGLAAVAEGQGQWDKARQRYKLTIDQAGSDYPVITERVQARLTMLDRIAKPIVFGPEPPPATQPATPDSSAPATPLPQDDAAGNTDNRP